MGLSRESEEKSNSPSLHVSYDGDTFASVCTAFFPFLYALKVLCLKKRNMRRVNTMIPPMADPTKINLWMGVGKGWSSLSTGWAASFPEGLASGSAIPMPGPIICGVLVGLSVFCAPANVVEVDRATGAAGELTVCEVAGKDISDCSAIILNTSATGGSLPSGTDSEGSVLSRSSDVVGFIVGIYSARASIV